MKKILLILCFVCAGFVSCNSSQNRNDRQLVIFDTDLGNDVDDALAMDMLYKYIESGRIDLLGIMLSRQGKESAEYADIMNTWYGHQVPIGIVRNGADCEGDATNYAAVVSAMKNSDGQPLFGRSLSEYDSLPDAHILYRRLLAPAPDHSVVIVQVGFSTNLARLLDTPADRFSPLSGMELVSKKVKMLSLMACNLTNHNHAEYNVAKDIPAAQKLFAEWPTDMVVSPYELGDKIFYPAASIVNDFGWTDMHPVVEACKCYQAILHDRPTWDLTSLLYVAEGDKWFRLSPAGKIAIDSRGIATFTLSKNGNVKYLTVEDSDCEAISHRFVEIISSAPAKYGCKN